MRTPRVIPVLLLALLLAVPVGAGAQSTSPSVGSGFQFQAFNFDDALGATTANLMLVPFGVRVPLGDRFSADLYGGWARGQVEREGVVYSLDGLVDTQFRSQFAAAPWAVVTVALNLPTGNPTHDFGEAVVASVLATDMLGFREANWGTGLGITTGIATARRIGAWGIGAGLSHRIAGDFEPSADENLSYTPGNETRARVGLDRNVGGSGKVTAGLTVQHFTVDQLDGRNLFQAGNRVRADLSYAFRVNASTWTLYGASLWRERGDVTLPQLDGTGQIVGDTTFTTGSQNLVVAGVTGSIPLTPGYRIRPALDLRVQDREEDAGSGWLLGMGGDVPIRLFGSYDVFPRGQFLFGSMTGTTGESHSIHGMEAGLTVRWRR